MHVNVLFFGMLRDLTGRSQEQIDLPEGARLETVFEHYASQFPRLREMADSIALARNHEFAGPEAVLGEGDEVALMPPVSGGGTDGRKENLASRRAESSHWLASAADERGFYALTRHAIDITDLKQRVLQGSDGAVLAFEGVVRNNSNGRRTRYLDYDCYVPMALRKMQQIGRDILDKHAVDRIAVVHRLGRLEIGETSVAIIVTSAHRKPAYEASLEAINRLKKLVPIWKKEYFEDGQVWIEGEWETGVPRSAGEPQQVG